MTERNINGHTTIQRPRPSAYPADRKTFPIDKWNVTSQRLRNGRAITKISLMPTHMSAAPEDGFQIPAIWASVEAVARADWMHEQIKAGLPAHAPEVVVAR